MRAALCEIKLVFGRSCINVTNVVIFSMKLNEIP